jgi:hypothetical protein
MEATKPEVVGEPIPAIVLLLPCAPLPTSDVPDTVSEESARFPCGPAPGEDVVWTTGAGGPLPLGTPSELAPPCDEGGDEFPRAALSSETYILSGTLSMLGDAAIKREPEVRTPVADTGEGPGRSCHADRDGHE